MGTYDNGAFGSFHGRVGNLVGSSWKGINYMKARPNTGQRKSSEKQIIHRAKFQYAAGFVQTIFPIIQVGYRKMEDKKTAKNAAMSEIMNYSIIGEYPSFGIDYPNFRIAKGSLQQPQRCSVDLNENAVVFNWSQEVGSKDDPEKNPTLKARMNDNIILVALANGFDPCYSLNTYIRSDLTGEIGLPYAPAGTEVHCYIASAATDNSNCVSNSVYVGSVIMP